MHCRSALLMGSHYGWVWPWVRTWVVVVAGENFHYQQPATINHSDWNWERAIATKWFQCEVHPIGNWNWTFFFVFLMLAQQRGCFDRGYTHVVGACGTNESFIELWQHYKLEAVPGMFDTLEDVLVFQVKNGHCDTWYCFVLYSLISSCNCHRKSMFIPVTSKKHHNGSSWHKSEIPFNLSLICLAQHALLT